MPMEVNYPDQIKPDYEELLLTPGYHAGASFTVELGSLYESGYPLALDAYPIFDPDYRDVLNAKIIDHYRFREIGYETPGAFNFALRRRMNEIMPYYNKLYQLETDKLDSLMGNYDLYNKTDTTDHSDAWTNSTSSETQKQTGGTSSDSSGRNVSSTTPQMQLSGREDYASALADSLSHGSTTSDTDASATGSQSSDATTNSTQDYLAHTYGRSGIMGADALNAARAAIINIDMLIIDELADLFFGIYKCNYPIL